MRVLLDTSTLLWWLVGSDRLSPAAMRTLSATDTRIVVSAASGWEIATKHRLGKLVVPDEIATRLEDIADRNGWEVLPLTMRHAQAAGNLRGDHKDPFDRILTAQAMHEKIPIVTNDPALGSLGATMIW